MRLESERYQALKGNAAVQSGGGILGRLIAFVIGSIALVGALLFSVVLFAMVLATAVVGGGYLWWKTRALRKHVREQMQSAMRDAQRDLNGRNANDSGSDSVIIEGEYVREGNVRDDVRR
ncbi:MAG TPA: hypothetical protein VFB54_07810 [Burkholderiales bacterium]|nr:hypothetical protein [Burkholderiales bacterium]